MRVNLPASIEHVLEARRVAYLAAWPAGAQLEALTEAAAGRPEKLRQLQADIARIKADNPKPQDQNAI